MANRTLRDLPVTTTPAAADILHNSQSLTDKSITMSKISTFVLVDSDNAPEVITVTGTTHSVGTTTKKQIIITTIASDCTFTFPGSYGDGYEIIIINDSSSTGNVLGTPDSLVLLPGQEVVYMWDGSSFIRRQFTADLKTGTSAPTNTPSYVGQRFLDTTAKIEYIAFGTSSSSDWIPHVRTGTTIPSITPDFVGQIFVDTTNDVAYISSGTASSADWVNVTEPELVTSVKTSDYTILDTDKENIFIANPNSVQYGTLTISAPATGSNTSKIRRVEHGSNQGLVRVDANGTQRFNFNGNDLQYILLYEPGQYIDYYWNTNTSKWSVVNYNISFNTSFQGWSDYTTSKIGCGVTYSGKSAAIDFTGMVITESTSNFTAVVVEDTGGTGTSGIFYLYNLSSDFTFWTNTRTLTASDSTTATVNEISGSSKNIGYNLHHGFGVSSRFIQKEIAVSIDKTEANTFYSGAGDTAGSAQKSNYYGIDSSNVAYYTANNGGFGWTNATGDNNVLSSQDYFVSHRLVF